MENLITMKEVLEITGLKRMALQHYIDTKRLVPVIEGGKGRGNSSMFNAEDVKNFTVSRFSLSKAKSILENLGYEYSIKRISEQILSGNKVEVNETILLYKNGIVQKKVKNLNELKI